MQDSVVTHMFFALDLTGVVANAMLGSVIARRMKFDVVGFATLAVLSGLGGGMIRDLLLQHGPPAALVNQAYLFTALGTAAFAFLVHVEGRWWNRVWPWLDAIAVGCWAAAGAQKTLHVGLGWLPAILLGAMTAVGGGVVRDIVLRRVPTILGGNTLYATCALTASAALVGLNWLGLPTIGMVTALVVGAGFCLVARWRGWILPGAEAWAPAQRVSQHVAHRYRAVRYRTMARKGLRETSE